MNPVLKMFLTTGSVLVSTKSIIFRTKSITFLSFFLFWTEFCVFQRQLVMMWAAASIAGASMKVSNMVFAL